MDRRHFLIGAGALAASGISRSAAAPPLQERLSRLERSSGGRLGVALLESGSGRRFSWRGDETFPMCSTFKFLLAGALLQAAEKGRTRLGRRIAVRPSDLLSYSPFARSRAGGSATIAELARATIVDSDNAAANLLLPVIGGPPGLTRFARTMGDGVTRLDRVEPDLGEAAPGDPRDTSSPDAMVENMERLLAGPVLGRVSRQRLADWMIACRTGKARLRAGLPPAWRVGDKTGSGANGTCNDIAVVWRPGERHPVLIAAYLTGSTLAPALRESILASVGHALAEAGPGDLSPGDAARLRS